MKYEDVLVRLSPCGLDCGRCADYESGEISRLSRDLFQLLGNYEKVAAMKKGKNPLFSGYQNFREILSSFAGGPCGGCRSDRNQCFIVCGAKSCHREKGVDFCFQCEEYPCARQFTGRLRDRWLERNNRMKEIGAVAFYLEQIKAPRY